METNILHTIVNSGLYSTSGTTCSESYFSYLGCQVNLHSDCEPNKGCNVFDASGYANLDDSRNHPENVYEFRICDSCLYFAQYGEE